MKNKTITLVFAGFVIASFFAGRESAKEGLRPYEYGPVIIWNDDPESIPMDGELVRLEMQVNDTVYIGPKHK
jgi:hypothetical protein